MKNSLRFAAAPLLVLAVAACKNPLDVKNLSSPDVERVFALPATIEQTIGSGYQQCRNTGMQNGSIYSNLSTMSLEGHSQLNNFNMGPRGGIPRAPVLNDRSSPSIFQEFSQWQRQARTLSNAVAALDKLTEGGGTLGSVGQNLRGRAFGFFVVACNLGYSALLYDSVGIVKPGMPSDETPALSSAQDAMNVALDMLDTAVTIASRAEAAAGFPTVAAWLSGTALSRDNFVRFVRSYAARFRAGVARTPAQRTAVNWTKVLADAENGITADVVVQVRGTTGWNQGWPGGTMHSDATWHQISPFYWGMGDISGGYDNWLRTPLNSRFPDAQFLIVTPDLRLPQGSTRAAQQTASTRPASHTGRPYLENRPSGQDNPASPWGTSYYNHFRYRYIQATSAAGNWPEFLKAENDLLAAEALYRLGRFAEAAAKVDLSRTARGGLPSLVDDGVTTGTARIPGANCVPRVPLGPSFTSTQCGDLLEALKWEKRVELAFNFFHGWFWDSRGWGDLIENTPLEFPVPNQELDARQKPFYNLGGGGQSSAAKGTYGF
jgi:hypothetical protein